MKQVIHRIIRYPGSPFLKRVQVLVGPGVTICTLDVAVMCPVISTATPSSSTQTGVTVTASSKRYLHIFTILWQGSKRFFAIRHSFLLSNRFEITPHIQYNQKIVLNTWNKETNTWKVKTDAGTEFTANFIISGTGILHVPKFPNIPGITSFSGDAFHTAQWKTGYDPRNKTVGIIGTGASAVQAVPSLANMGVKNLKVFQRTPCWTTPRLGYKYPRLIKTMFHWLPFTNVLHRYILFWFYEATYWLIFDTDGLLSKVRIIFFRICLISNQLSCSY